MIWPAAIALLVLPLLVLRGRTLLTWYGTEAAAWIYVWILWRRGIDIDPLLVAALTFALLLVFVATGKNVRWSANRAALLAAVVYCFAIAPMTKVPIDGDEPYYLLVTESIVHDFDLDLANQYRDLAHSASGRTDLKPQMGDPAGAHGEQYSRTEPFLSLLMIPGYLLGGLNGAVATIVLFGVLLVRSTLRWFEDEGIPDDVCRAVFPLFAFGPPLLFYAARVWPEVPAAFCFVEALRGMRAHRAKRWVPALFALVMLKLRFVLVAIALIALHFSKDRRLPAGHENRPLGRAAGFQPARKAIALAAILLAPMLLLWLISGSPLNVHSWRELLPAHPENYGKGLFGLLLDGAAGLAFQAPFFLLGIYALTRWREMPRGFRLGIVASLLYLLYLLPRDEWHGGWSPPLRYVVFLMPVLALGAAAVWHRVSRELVAVIALWTIGVAVHGFAYPWRLFHIANGENAVGEWLSSTYHADFSRLFPSFIRLNDAALIGGVSLVVLLLIARFLPVPSHLAVSGLALAMAAGFVVARQPGRSIHFEDSHVIHDGGELYPTEYTPIRFAYRGGWTLNAGQSASFLAREGPYTLHYITGPGARITIDGAELELRPSPDRYATATVVILRSGRVTLRCVAGAVNLDRMDHE
jgi:hypothetical protein